MPRTSLLLWHRRRQYSGLGRRKTALASPTDYTYDEATALFSTVAGVLTVPAATYTQDSATGEYTITPGSVTLTVTGTI